MQCSDYFPNISKEYQLGVLYFNIVLQDFLLYTSKEILLFQSKLLPILFMASNAQLHVAPHLCTNIMCLIKKKKKRQKAF